MSGEKEKKLKKISSSLTTEEDSGYTSYINTSSTSSNKFSKQNNSKRVSKDNSIDEQIHKNDIKKRAIECTQTSTPVKEAIQDKPTFSLHEYEIQETVGRGSYAVVKLAVHATTHKQVAVKIISKLKAPDDFLEKFLPREIEIARMLSHKNVTLFYHIEESDKKVYMVMEYAKNGDLLHAIKRAKTIDEKQTKKWSKQCLMGLQYLHRKHIVHRDLKCENILLNKNNYVQLTDFGFARKMNSGYMYDETNRDAFSETYCGSYAYAAPEILRGRPYNPYNADVWSLGVIFYTMLYGKLPFDDTNHKLLLKQVTNPLKLPGQSSFGSGKSAKHPQVSEEGQNALKNIINCEISLRWYIDEILGCRWLKKVQIE